MANPSSYRFMALLLVLYLATTAFFLLFIQHTSERHMTASHQVRSPLLLRRAAARKRPAQAPSLVRRVPQRRRAPAAAAKSARRPLILFWTPLWERFENWARFFSVQRLGGCRARCAFSGEAERLEEAALVLFSAADLHRMPPPERDGRPERFPRQLWALFTLDPPPAEPRRLQPQRYDRLFNWTVSYRRDSDVPLQYGQVLPLPGPRRRAAAVRLPPGRRALFRPQLCDTRSRREEYVLELSRHMDVDVLGPCGNTTCGPAPQCLSRLGGNYTFYLALEAAHCTDFVSARLHQALRHGLIPVVRGRAEYARLAPPGSYIDASAFAGPEQLARYLRGLTDVQLRRYHRWRDTHQVLPAAWTCDVCMRLHRLAEEGGQVRALSGEQLIRWLERGRCQEDAMSPSAA